VIRTDWRTRLRELGEARYHHRHPFNVLMHAGRLDHEDLRLWVANRYYYQTRIPIKDALILAKSEDPEFRRVWVQRVLDHDGRGAADQPGGLELWIQLGRALGLTRAQLESQQELLPGVRRACDDYVELVQTSDLVTAVAASLTEYFAGDLMKARIEAWTRHYPSVARAALRYFDERVIRAPEDADYALRFVARHATTVERAQRCLAAFERKCEVLWRLLSAVYIARRQALRPRLATRASLVSRPGRPASLLAPEKALELNDTATAVLERARGELTLAQIIVELGANYGVETGVLDLDLATFVGELEVRRLLVFEGDHHHSQGPT
jgi:pyrroloquinoline-quinone synthase